MQEKNTRAAERFPVKASVSFRTDVNSNKLHQGLVMDIGFLGICIFSPTLLEVGKPMRLWVMNPNSADLTKIDGTVAWVSLEDTYGDSPYWVKAGISFNSLNEAQKSEVFELLPPTARKSASNKAKKNILAVLP